MGNDAILDDLERVTANQNSSGDPILDDMERATSAPKRAPISVPEAPKPAFDLGQIPDQGDVTRGLAETAGKLVTGTLAPLAGGVASYAGRFLPGGDWERAQKWADDTMSAINNLAPEPQSTTGKALTGALGYVGQKISDLGSAVGQKTLDVTGSPAAASIADAAAQTLPMVLGGKAIGRASTFGNKPLEVAPKPVEPVKVNPINGPDVPVPDPSAPLPEVTASPSPVQSAAALADAVKRNPETVVKDEVPRASEPTVSTSKNEPVAPQAEQDSNAQVLARVGHDAARKSALNGDARATMFENDLAKRPDQAGQDMANQFAQETAANRNFAERLVDESGGTKGLDQESMYTSGSNVDKAWSALQNWHKNIVNGLYEEAKTRLGDQPVQLNELGSLAQDQTQFPGGADVAAFQDQMGKVMRQLGISDKKGNIQPTTATQAENFRQWLNKDHGPEVWDFVKQAKNAIDNDVTQAAGQDIFEKARAAHQLAQRTLYDDKDLARIFQKDSKGNRMVDVEKIPQKIASLGVDSHAHFAKVMGNMPAGLEGLGSQALREMAGHYTNNILAKGSPTTPGARWGYKGVSKYLDANNKRMSQIMSPEFMAKIHDLEKAGKLTATDRTYVGAEAQKENFAKHAILQALPKGGAMLGGAIGSVFSEPVSGTIAGGTLGTKAASVMQSRFEQNAVKNKLVKLR